jgi:hypothetical protein
LRRRERVLLTQRFIIKSMGFIMPNRFGVLIAALTAALLLALGAGAANASRSFSVTNNTLLTYTSPGLTFSPAGRQIICAVTLTASLHRVFAKVRGTLAGFVNGARVERCSNSTGIGTTEARPLVSHVDPWHISYESFRGTLPRITEILVIIRDARFLTLLDSILIGGRLGCLYRSDIAVGTAGRSGAAEYTSERLIPLRPNTFLLQPGELNTSTQECEPEGELTGTFTATLPPVVRLL